MKNSFFDIIIVGAGAAGLMAGITAANNNKRVLILEKKDKPGKKILATGNGKCNYTNDKIEYECFYGNTKLINNIISAFSKDDCINFFRRLGIYPKCKNGYYYPNSEQAGSIVKALVMECEQNKVTIETSANILGINYKKEKFWVKTENGIVTSKKMIIATGLRANPKLGSDGSFFTYVKGLGHSFSPIVPALCGFTCEGFDFKKVSGVRTEAEVKVFIKNKFVKSDKGELQLADYGISGIPVFQVSHDISLALYNKLKCEVELDLFPAISEVDLFSELRQRFNRNLSVADSFNGLLNQKLIDPLCSKAGVSSKIDAYRIGSKQIEQLVKVIKHLKVTAKKARDFEFAQVCAGGIKSEEIDIETLESKFIPDLYFAGEILDVDGICGGYNLQWAWSSGFVAGTSASR